MSSGNSDTFDCHSLRSIFTNSITFFSRAARFCLFSFLHWEVKKNTCRINKSLVNVGIVNILQILQGTKQFVNKKFFINIKTPTVIKYHINFVTTSC